MFTRCDFRRSTPSDPRLTSVIFVRMRFLRASRRYADRLIRTVTLRFWLAPTVNDRRPIRVLRPRVSDTTPLHSLLTEGPQARRTLVRRLRLTRSVRLEMRRLRSTVPG